MNENFANTAATHFVRNSGATGVLRRLNENHINHIANTIAPHTLKIVNGIKTGMSGLGGSAGSGGSMHTGGAIASGGFLPFPQTHKEMYHYMLNLSPQQFEAHREGAAQILGSRPSPMWGKMADGSEPLEASADHYENILRMPNVHAAARMIEADGSSPTGGGFFKALKHVARKATNFYKIGRAGLNFVDRNKEVLLDLPGVRDYKEGIGAFIESAKAIDDAVNPFVDAAIDASQQATTLEGREKLKKMATQSIDNAIQTHMPNAKKYMDVAKDLNQTVKNTSVPYGNVKRPIGMNPS